MVAGGTLERLIGLTKVPLKKTLGRTYVSLIVPQTLAVQIEVVFND